MQRPIDTPLLRKALRAGPSARIQRMLQRIEPDALALLLVELPPAELKALLRQLRDDDLARALHAIPEALLPEIIEQIDDGLLAEIVDQLKEDDAADLLEGLDQERQAAILALVSPEHAALVDRLLRYAPGTAGNLMIPRFLSVSSTATVGEAIAIVRAAPSHVPIFYLYVLDERDHLVGVTSLSQLVRAQDDTEINTLMTPNLVWVPPEADEEQVARLVTQHNLLAVPVVSDGRLVGLVTVDDVIDIVEREATEDMYNMAGLSEGDRVFSTPLQSLKKRLPWNALNLMTSLTAAFMVSLFEGTIGKLVALATFMPVIAGIGGNTGNQTLTVIIRGITLGELEFSSGVRALTKEIAVGVSIGVLLGLTTGVISYFWRGNPMLGVVIALAMVANLFVAAFMGTAIPLTLRRLGMDPALGGSILLTMCTDVFGFLSFLGLAALMMNYLL